MYYSAMTSVTRDDWRERTRESGLTLVDLADRNGKSFSTVYGYSRGARRPSDGWITSVGSVLHEYANEWICSACQTRNAASRHGCKACGHAYDGYLPGTLRPTVHGAAQ
jgi:hypothetical protein